MKRTDEIERYLLDPIKLIDILNEVVKKKGQTKPSEIPADSVVQFNEISKTIDRLKEAGSVVPDELRRLKIQLSHHAAEHEKLSSAHEDALIVLKEMESRLGSSLTDLRATIARLVNPVSKKTKAKRYVKRTSPSILAKEVRIALRELGGSGRKTEIFEKMKLKMEGKFKIEDLERDAKGILNWEKWAAAEKVKMVKEGVIQANAGFGIWQLRRK